MCGANRLEVPMVDRRDVGGAQALGDRDHRGVRSTQREVRVLPHEVGHPGEILRGSGFDDQFAAGQRLEERGLDSGSRLDLEEVGDLGDDRGRDDDRSAEPPEQRGACLMVTVLALSIATSGPVSAISIGALRELLAQDLLGALGEIRRTVEQPDEGEVPHRLVS